MASIDVEIRFIKWFKFLLPILFLLPYYWSFVLEAAQREAFGSYVAGNLRYFLFFVGLAVAVGLFFFVNIIERHIYQDTLYGHRRE